MIIVGFVLFAALILAWLVSPGDFRESAGHPVADFAAAPLASPAD